MDITESDLRAIAEKLKPCVTGFSTEERELLNVVFALALAADDDVVGMSMNAGGLGGSTPLARPPIRPPSAPSGSTGGATGTGGSSGPSSNPSGSFSPVSVKFF
jgi:hypothetical protein